MSYDIPCDFAPKINQSWVQFALGFGVAAIHIPGLIGASVGTSYFLLMIVMPLLIYNIRIELTLRHFWALIFVCYATLSLFWTFSFKIGLFHLIQIIVLAMVFYYGSYLNDLTSIVQGFALGIGVSAIIAIFQVFGHEPVYAVKLPSGAPAGLFVNPNMFSEASAILLVALIVLKQWWWTIVTLPGIALAHSRAALMALAVCGLIYMWNRSKSFVLLMTPVLILFVIGAYYNNHFDVSSLQERLQIWVDTIRGLSLFGQGVGSFEVLMPKYAHYLDTVKVVPKYAHNDFLHLIFEFGIGFLFLIPLITYTFKSNANERYVLFAAGVIGFFSFPFHVPVSAFLIVLFAGYFNRANTFRNDGVYC